MNSNFYQKFLGTSVVLAVAAKLIMIILLSYYYQHGVVYSLGWFVRDSNSVQLIDNYVTSSTLSFLIKVEVSQKVNTSNLSIRYREPINKDQKKQKKLHLYNPHPVICSNTGIFLCLRL
jgi:hypothetical protein